MQAQALAERVQQVNAESVEIACVDEGTTCQRAAEAAEHGIELQVFKVPELKRGFALLPRCGSESAVPNGRGVFAGSPAITNSWLKPWRSYTFLPSPP